MTAMIEKPAGHYRGYLGALPHYGVRPVPQEILDRVRVARPNMAKTDVQILVNGIKGVRTWINIAKTDLVD